MCSPFTDDDIGKLVETAAGEEVGVVAAVDGAVARVSPVPTTGGADATTPSMGHGTGETQSVEAASVREITDDRVFLEAEFEVSTDAASSTQRPPAALGGDEIDEIHEKATSDPGAEADPSELTNSSPDPEAELSPDGAEQRTDAEVPADDDPKRTDAAVEPDDETRRSDAEADPDSS